MWNPSEGHASLKIYLFCWLYPLENGNRFSESRDGVFIRYMNEATTQCQRIVCSELSFFMKMHYEPSCRGMRLRRQNFLRLVMSASAINSTANGEAQDTGYRVGISGQTMRFLRTYSVDEAVQLLWLTDRRKITVITVRGTRENW